MFLKLLCSDIPLEAAIMLKFHAFYLLVHVMFLKLLSSNVGCSNVPLEAAIVLKFHIFNLLVQKFCFCLVVKYLLLSVEKRPIYQTRTTQAIRTYMS